MDLEDLASALEIWEIDFYEAVEPTRSGEGWIQNFFLVCCSKDDDICIGIETIHFHEQLVQSSISLVIAASSHARSLLSNSIYLIYEDDRRCAFFCLFEEVSHSLGTDTDIHLDEFTTTDGEEGNFALSCAGLCDHCLAGAWWTSQERTLGDPCA